MPVAISVIFGDSAYYSAVNLLNSFRIGEKPDSDLYIPNLGCALSVFPDGNIYKIEVSNGKDSRSIALKLNVPTVIDYDKKIAVFLTENNGQTTDVRIPSDCEFRVGKSDKVSGSGLRNEIVLDLPFISRNHFKVVCNDGEMYVSDCESTNGLFLNGKKISSSAVRSGDVLSVFTVRIIVRDGILTFENVGDSLKLYEIKETYAGNGEPLPPVVFEKSPRIKKAVTAEKIEIPAPPALLEKPQIDIVSTFLPAAATVVMGVIMAFVLHGASMLYSLPMTLSGVIISVVNYRKQLKKYETEKVASAESYTAELKDAEEKLKSFNSNQLSVMEETDPSTKKCVAKVKKLDVTMWDRSPRDDDFLRVRVGSGTVRSAANIVVGTGYGIPDREKLDSQKKVIEENSFIKDAPVSCSIRDNHVIGILGNVDDTNRLISNMIIQLTTHHAYSDLRIVYLCSENMNWAAELPHMSGFTASDKEGADEVVSKAVTELRKRAESLAANRSYGKKSEFLPHFVFIVQDPSLFPKNSALSELVFARSDLGTSVIIAAEELYQLPEESGFTIRVGSEGCEMFSNANAAEKTEFVLDRISEGDIRKFAQRMNTVRCREEAQEKTSAAKSGDIPTKYTLFDMLGIRSAEEIDLGKRWSSSDAAQHITAPIGVGSNNRIISLDMISDGPHGLVAGTTGSGKSELLLGYLLSLAVNYHPYEVAFVIIDFKGGGMADRLSGLPHLINTITNIDGKEIDRSLKSLKAELLHRQKVFKEYNAAHNDSVTDINDYLERYKAGKATEPLPHIIFLVDEFAELKKEQPDFMKELISTARIGRSLGIHLILATQKPDGQVDDQIWSNSRFKICLKVESERDSTAVIKHNLAAMILEPGRAYLRVGNDEVFELIQSGYSKAEVEQPDGSRPTQSALVVEHIRSYCEKNGIEKLPGISMPPLSSNIPYNTAYIQEPVSSIPVGICDNPDKQAQPLFKVDLTQGNLIVVGSALSGKTNLLRLLIRSLADRYTPEEVNIYAIDFASMSLRAFSGLRHVGGVVTSFEDEKLKSLMRMLAAEKERRKNKFFKAGVSSFTAYREAGNTDLPHIVVMIDNITALREQYFQDDTELVRLCSDGLSVGISVVAANSQTKGLTFKYLNNFFYKVATFSNDSGEYMSLFGHCRETIPNIKGRCLVSVDGAIYECQSFKAFGGDKEKESTAAIERYIENTNRKYPDMRAVPIPVLPDTFSTEYVRNQIDVSQLQHYSIPVGMDYESVLPVTFDLRTIGLIATSGRNVKSKDRFFAYLVNALEEFYPGQSEVYIVDSMTQPLQELQSLPNVKKYSMLAAHAQEYMAEIDAKLADRYNVLLAEGGTLKKDTPLILLVLNSQDAATLIGMDKSLLGLWQNITGKYRAMNVCVLLSDMPNTYTMTAEVYKKAAEVQQYLYFDDIAGGTVKFAQLTSASLSKFKKPLVDGDAYYLHGTECIKLKIGQEKS